MSKQDPTLEALKKDPQALKGLLSSPETRQLMDLLNRSAGAGLDRAAREAAAGKPEALMGILNQVMGSQEGSRAVEQLQKKAGGGK